MKWNGKYYVTLVLADGTVCRQDADRQVPAGATVASTDNGMQGEDYYRKVIREVEADVAAGKYRRAPK